MVLPEHPPGTVHTGSIADEVARGQVELHVTVVSPERQIFEGNAHWLTLTGVDGQFGIWPGHVSLVAALGSGLLRICFHRGEEARFVVRGGFVSVAANTVTVLVDQAVTKEEVDEAQARAELEETISALAHPKSDREFRALLDRRAWSQSRIAFANE